MKNLLCKIGIHKWGKKKQWLKPNGTIVITNRCELCGKLKENKNENS